VLRSSAQSRQGFWKSKGREKEGVIMPCGRSLTGPAFEKHYSVAELANLWHVAYSTAVKCVDRQPGALKWGATKTPNRRS
jgi:hypothetical protein